jgi:hypothetical protein
VARGTPKGSRCRPVHGMRLATIGKTPIVAEVARAMAQAAPQTLKGLRDHSTTTSLNIVNWRNPQ